MRNFILQNWYRLMTAAAMLIFACAFFISILTNNVANAGTPNIQTPPSPANTWMVVKGNAIYEVTWDRFSDGYKCEFACRY